MAYRLLLNPAKTKVIWCAFPWRQHLIPTCSYQQYALFHQLLHPGPGRSLLLDRCLYHDPRHRDRQILFCSTLADDTIRCTLPRHALLTLIRVLMVGKVDYCNPVLTSIPCYLMDRSCLCLMPLLSWFFSVRRSNHITPTLRQLHWLRGPRRSSFVCMHWRTVASMVHLHLISPRASI